MFDLQGEAETQELDLQHEIGSLRAKNSQSFAELKQVRAKQKVLEERFTYLQELIANGQTQLQSLKNVTDSIKTEVAKTSNQLNERKTRLANRIARSSEIERLTARLRALGCLPPLDTALVVKGKISANAASG